MEKPVARPDGAAASPTTSSTTAPDGPRQSAASTRSTERLVAFEERLDAAIREVAHPAVDAFRRRPGLDEEPEPHPLHATTDQEPPRDEHQSAIIREGAPGGPRWRHSSIPALHGLGRASGASSPVCYCPAMLRIGASSHGESHLRMLRVVRRGDRHDARDLTVACRFEGDFADAFVDGRSAGSPPRRGAEEPGPCHRPAACRRRDRALRAGALRAAARRPSAPDPRARRGHRAALESSRGRRQSRRGRSSSPARRSAARRRSRATASRWPSSPASNN